MKITVLGLASGKTLGSFEVTDTEEALMFFLMRMGLPIASSCAGDGVCKKCKVNGEVLSCQTTTGAWIREHGDEPVTITYL